MIIPQSFGRRRVLTSVTVAAFSVLSMPMTAQAAGAASIKGNWAGGGTVKVKEGKSERVRCRVSYGRIAGQNFSVNARCATSDVRIDQTGRLKRVSTNRYVGSLHNQQYNVSARVVVTVSGRQQTVSISSRQGSASIRLKRR